jgi:hypothetical protein
VPSRTPAAENDRDPLLGEQVARFFGKEIPVGSGIDDYWFKFASEQAAFSVLILDKHEYGVLEHRLADGHSPGERMQDTDLDGVVLCACRSSEDQ